jgi:hypothetical protein
MVLVWLNNWLHDDDDDNGNDDDDDDDNDDDDDQLINRSLLSHMEKLISRSCWAPFCDWGEGRTQYLSACSPTLYPLSYPAHLMMSEMMMIMMMMMMMTTTTTIMTTTTTMKTFILLLPICILNQTLQT